MRPKKKGPKTKRPLKKKFYALDLAGVYKALDELDLTVSGIYRQGQAVADSAELLRQQLPELPNTSEDDIPF